MDSYHQFPYLCNCVSAYSLHLLPQLKLNSTVLSVPETLFKWCCLLSHTSSTTRPLNCMAINCSPDPDSNPYTNLADFFVTQYMDPNSIPKGGISCFGSRRSPPGNVLPSLPLKTQDCAPSNPNLTHHLSSPNVVFLLHTVCFLLAS